MSTTRNRFFDGRVYRDLSPKQRYVIVPEGPWFAIGERQSDDDVWPFPVHGIESMEEAVMIRGRLIRGDSIDEEDRLPADEEHLREMGYPKKETGR